MSISGRGLTLALSQVLAGAERGKIVGQQARTAATQLATDREREARRQMLADQLLSGQVTDATTARGVAQQRRQSIQQAAAKIRGDARYKAIWGLPDEELVHAVEEISTHPERAVRPTTTPGDLAEVQRHGRLAEVART